MKKHFSKIICILLSLFFVMGCVEEDDEAKLEPINWYKLKMSVDFAPDGTEISRSEYTYDSEGREIEVCFYVNGVLNRKYTNYTYNGLECSYDELCYKDDGSLCEWFYKHKRVYLDENYIKLTLDILYDEYRSEIRRTSYSYDSEGREIEVCLYDRAKLIVKQTDYKYNGLECEFSYDVYRNYLIETPYKFKRVYLDRNYVKIKSSVTSLSNGGEYYREEYEYDSEGREIGMRTYLRNRFVLECGNYVYNGQECFFDAKEIREDGLGAVSKKRRTYK